MKLSAPISAAQKTTEIPFYTRKKSGWLHTAFLQASCLSQSVVTAGALGVDFFDPTAVRAANCNALKAVAQTPCS